MERDKSMADASDDNSETDYSEDFEGDVQLGLPGITHGGCSRKDLWNVVDREGKKERVRLELVIGRIGENGGCSSQRRFGQFRGSSLAASGNVWFGDEPAEPSGSALAGSTPEGQDFDSDWQNKRAKFESSILRTEFQTSSADDGTTTIRGSFSDCQNSFLSSVPSRSCNVARNGASNCEDGVDSMEEDRTPMDLSDDLLHMVFSFLGHVDLCRASMVCKQWRTAGSHEDFWRCLDFGDRSISVAQFEVICRRYPRATAVNFSGAPNPHLLAMRALLSLRNLEALTIGRGHLGDTFFLAITDCQMLKRLIVNDATLGNIVQDISFNHDRLQHLHITKCRVLRISVRCPQLQTLSLKRSNMVHTVLYCPLLHDLDIGSCHKLPDAAVRSAVTSCPLLEKLDLSNCSCVSDETLREIALVCANLRVLDASYCPNISLESVRLPMLTDLKLDSCDGITSASMAAISHSYMLEELDLDNCSLLTSVSLDLPHLRSISLVYCRKFFDLSLHCPMLSSVTLWNSAALSRISITSNALEKLVLQKEESLISLSLQCQYLQEVDLSDCESLTNSVCEVFSDGGGCPMLKSLVLDNCESLTNVGLQSTSLVSLSLAGCRAIASVDLSCPYLYEVCLDGCDHLAHASFSPVGLKSLNLGICPKLEVLAIDAPQMVLLELKGCGILSEVCINCPMLTSLDASFCSQLQDDCLLKITTSCPLIESLILMSCPAIGADGLSSLHRLKNLIYLDLSYTFLMDLQPVFQACMQLKVLKLQACKYLDDSSLEALYREDALPALQELDLSYGMVRQSAIEELLDYCTRLTHLSLNGCENMHDLNWGFTCGRFSEYPSSYTPCSFSSSGLVNETAHQPRCLLEHLNCVGCPNIKKIFIPLSAQWGNLSFLNLSLSNNLKEVDITCSNLCFLNLSNCCSLEILKLECSRLTSLFLQSCNIDEAAVESAMSGCYMLETLDVRFCPKISAGSLGRLRMAHPSLRRLFSSLLPN